MSSLLKRFIIIFGSKGGVGKTMFARLLVDELIRLDLKYLAYDSDKENPDLYRYYKDYGSGVKRLDFLDLGAAGEMLSEIDRESPDVVVLDLPASSGEGTRDIFTKYALLETAEELGYALTIACVINTDNPVIASLKTMVDYCGDGVDYVVIKNLCWGDNDKFSMWDESKTRAKLITELKGVEVAMPSLPESAFLALSKDKTPFGLASKDTIGLAPNLLVRGFLMTGRANLSAAAEYLGLMNGEGN